MDISIKSFITAMLFNLIIIFLDHKYWHLPMWSYFFIGFANFYIALFIIKLLKL